MTKLTKKSKELILERLKERGYGDEIRAQEERWTEWGAAFYDSIITEEEAEWIKARPLSSNESIAIEGHSQIIKVVCEGTEREITLPDYIYGLGNSPAIQKRLTVPDSSPHRRTFSHVNASQYLLDIEMVEHLSRAGAALRDADTVEDLRKLWPEIEPLLKGIANPHRQNTSGDVPDSLNVVFKLL